ncbi:hypothetical protein IVB12_31395 [Bradyrhizobium sp. 179]|uniref:hypothetical protein n=1 Tax=Bradyrhizobium sp. 179 TaxID=2782648 RepID=UPI001FFAF9E9|nr:hypothetical protein [Bradyrhizobium sp. 179]MCK1546324.1 hypothetical protein [Bradyrhizobium sp. 179]
MADQRFKPGALSKALLWMEREPSRAAAQASFIRAEALVGLGVAEGAVGRESPEEADRELAAAEKWVRASLELNPADSFLWLMLYSVQTAREGFATENIRYIDQSYSSGPHEGWIALRRNRVVLSIFPMLSVSAEERVVSEFAAMVDSDLIEDAVMNLTGVGWPQRQRLLAALDKTDVQSRKSLQKRLLIDGVKVAIPGIEYDERPWR